MKAIVLSFCLLLAGACLQAQAVPYNVVFDLTSRDTADQQSVVRWMNLISNEHPDAKLEVVLYGQALDMVRNDRSTVAPALARLLQNKNLAVKVCAVAMKHHNINTAQLLPGVSVVPDGIYEIISRQRDGWGYIKVAR